MFIAQKPLRNRIKRVGLLLVSLLSIVLVSLLVYALNVSDTRAQTLAQDDINGLHDSWPGEAQPAAYDLATAASDPFSLAWTSEEAEYSYSVAWGDVDGDGDLDLAVGNHSQNRLYVNQGDMLESWASWASTESDVTFSVAWGDVDGDGDLDMAVGNGQTTIGGGQVNRIYRNDGGALVTTAAYSFAEVENSRSVAWGDYNGDGKFDLAVGNYGQPNRLYRNDSVGGVITMTLVLTTTESDQTFSMAWGDVDGDGDLDLMAGNMKGVNRLYLNNAGVLSVSADWSSAEADWTTSVAWGDVDGDNDLDLAVGNGCVDWQPTTQCSSSLNRLYLNDSAGGLITMTLVLTSTEQDDTRSVVWGDYDSDGDLDLFAANHQLFVGRPNRLYRNNGVMITDTAVWSSVEADVSVSVAWGDVDGDGDLDLAVGNGRAGQPNRVYRNNGGVMATSAMQSANIGNANELALGDYDGDGYLDLAVSRDYCCPRIYHNNGGVFDTNPAWSGAGGRLNSVAWGDYDGDGDLDLAVGYLYGAVNRLYRNDTAGGAVNMTQVWTSAEGDHTWSVAWGDVDSDGDLDLAVGNAWNQPTRVYFSDGVALSASASWSSSDTDNTYDVAWGDVDGDGDLDLAVGNYGVKVQMKMDRVFI